MTMKCFYIFTIFISISLVAATLVEAGELGTFSSHNEYHSGVSTFSLPVAEERQPLDETYVLAFINYTYTVNGEDKVFSAEKGKYGEGRILNVQGVLVHVTSANNINDHSACTPYLRGTKNLPFPLVPWIALVRRGDCNFEDKVKHVYAYKAAGIIIYNFQDKDNLDKMKIVDKERNITAITTYRNIGEQMGKWVDDGFEVYTSISEGQHISKPYSNINRTSVLFVSISFIVLMVISLVWLVFYYVQRFRYLQSKDKQSRRMCSVAKRIISKIPTRSIKTDEKESDSDCCAVCIEPYRATEVVRVLPCKHEFHKNCIDPWLLEHRTCPMCKMDILKHYGLVFTGSQESILELDLDAEVGDNPLRAREDNTRARSVSPSFVIQADHELMRSSSVESVTPIHRDDPDQCSLNGDKEDCDCKDELPAKANPSECEDDDESKVPNSASLPCTLRKCKNGESCRGSNNCYVWSSEAQKKADKYEKGCPKSKTICVHVLQGSDNEFLLPCNEDAESKDGEDAKEPKSPASSDSDGEDKPLAGGSS